MSYTARAYRDMSKVLKDQVDGILSEPLTRDERLFALETVSNIAVGMVQLFSKDNPNGFDPKRFYKDSGLSPSVWK